MAKPFGAPDEDEKNSDDEDDEGSDGDTEDNKREETTTEERKEIFTEQEGEFRPPSSQYPMAVKGSVLLMVFQWSFGYGGEKTTAKTTKDRSFPNQAHYKFIFTFVFDSNAQQL